jgi:excisionase family DNA binding protein
MAAPQPGLVVIAGDELKALLREVVRDEIEALRPSATTPGRVGTKEIAEALGVSRAKIHELAEGGTLPHVWVGDVRRFDVAECIAALQAQPSPAKRRAGPGRPRK